MYFRSLPINHVLNAHFSPIIYHKVHCYRSRARVNKSFYQTSLLKKCSPNGQISPIKSNASPAPSMVDAKNTSDFWQWYEQKLGFDPYERKFYTKGLEDGSSNSDETYTDKAQKERERRKKIGLANKGRVPWNKGKKHTSETRVRISQRTKEAMMDPKVKKKIAECRHAQSEQTKERIGTSLRRLWAEKLKWKRSRAKFLSIWAENIAEAAKRGGCDQQELDWNSYDKIKEEIATQQLSRAAARAEAKEMEQLAVARRKKERMAKLARKREELEQRAKARGVMKRNGRRKSKEEIEELTVAVGLKLKERLTKIHKRKISTNGQISTENQRTWEKFDLEFRKTGYKTREISLADEIQAAKGKRTEDPTSPALYSSGNQKHEI